MSAPTLPPAPARLSTMNCWPKARLSSGAMARANMSVVPPGANGTTMRTVLVGQAPCCASAMPGTRAVRPALRAPAASANALHSLRRCLRWDRGAGMGARRVSGAGVEAEVNATVNVLSFVVGCSDSGCKRPSGIGADGITRTPRTNEQGRTLGEQNANSRRTASEGTQRAAKKSHQTLACEGVVAARPVGFALPTDSGGKVSRQGAARIAGRGQSA